MKRLAFLIPLLAVLFSWSQPARAQDQSQEETEEEAQARARAEILRPDEGFHAQNPGEFAATRVYQSPSNFMFSFTLGPFKPDVENNSYSRIFGKKSMWLWNADLEYDLFQGFGTLGVGAGLGFGSVSGKGMNPGTTAKSADTTSLKILPTRILVSYYLDYFVKELSIPLVPYAKFGPSYTFWWTTRGGGALARDPGVKPYGGKWGYQLTAGLGLELNALDPDMGRDLDSATGINRVYLTAEWTRITADNFGGKGIDLGDSTFLFGLAFAF